VHHTIPPSLPTRSSPHLSQHPLTHDHVCDRLTSLPSKDPSLVVIAFLGTTLSFACFSGAAILSRRRSYLYLGGMLSSALSFLFLMSIANMFFHSSAAMTLQVRTW
jgi:hypothetical protein